MGQVMPFPVPSLVELSVDEREAVRDLGRALRETRQLIKALTLQRLELERAYKEAVERLMSQDLPPPTTPARATAIMARHNKLNINARQLSK